MIEILLYWTIIGALVFGLAMAVTDHIPDQVARIFMIACGPLVWLILAYIAIDVLSRRGLD